MPLKPPSKAIIKMIRIIRPTDIACPQGRIPEEQVPSAVKVPKLGADIRIRTRRAGLPRHEGSVFGNENSQFVLDYPLRFFKSSDYEHDGGPDSCEREEGKHGGKHGNPPRVQRISPGHR